MKLKTNKSLKKRIRKKGGLIISGHSCRRHGNMKKSGNFMRSTRKNKSMHKSDVKRLKFHISNVD